MRKLWLAFSCFLATTPLAWAHRPYIHHPYGTVSSPIEILDPEISRAYYRELNSRPEYYRIKSETPFLLHINILEPYRPEAQKDFKVKLFRGSQPMITLADDTWVHFYEPWGGDPYWMGPKFEQKVQAGEYNVVVSNPKNFGKYVLAVGTIDTFPPSEIIRTLFVLPKIKSRFFEKSPLSAYFNYSGLFVVLILTIVFLVVWLSTKAIKRHYLFRALIIS